MPRDCVYQLRLTREEKDDLARRAREQGTSIAKLIRQALGLGVPAQPLEDKADEPPADEPEWKQLVPSR